jgi:hypothetical protein
MEATKSTAGDVCHEGLATVPELSKDKLISVTIAGSLIGQSNP